MTTKSGGLNRETSRILSLCYYLLYHSVTVGRLHVTRMLNASRNRGCYLENYKRIFFHSFFKKPWVFRTGPGLKITSSLIKSLFKRFMGIYEIFTVIHF